MNHLPSINVPFGNTGNMRIARGAEHIAVLSATDSAAIELLLKHLDQDSTPVQIGGAGPEVAVQTYATIENMASTDLVGRRPSEMSAVKNVSSVNVESLIRSFTPQRAATVGIDRAMDGYHSVGNMVSYGYAGNQGIFTRPAVFNY